MAVRILHCGKSIENYNLCLEHTVAGFTTRGPNTGDTIFVAVRLKDKTVCGMQATLAGPTDFKPWQDGERYVAVFMLEKIEYSAPFDIQFLSQIGGKYWNLKYLQGAKVIRDATAIALLKEAFETNLREAAQYLSLLPEENLSEQNDEESDADNDLEGILEEIPEARISVMGTFQTISFRNETDELRGLEPLVNQNFYSLFPVYPSERTLLIPENRLFLSSGTEARGEPQLKGIRSIPDALLIIFNEKLPCPLQINLIEYECFGEGKTRSQEKSNYLNGQIIPQLMKFASSFSIVTDRQIREQTIRSWVEKIIVYVFDDEQRREKFTAWIKTLSPNLTDLLVGREIDRLLTESFRKNLKIMLIIDDLSAEQKDTINNVIRAFRLENGESINFLAYVVRLEQRINITDSDAEYALSVQ